MAATLDQTTRDEIVRLHLRGDAPADIARQLNVGHAAVHSSVRDHELTALRAAMGPRLTRDQIDALEVHEITGLFPMMSDAELDALADDIRDNGLRQPIVVCDGKVIDGRNRFEACRRRGLAPGPDDFRVREVPPEDLLGYVMSLNFYRRHLTDSQRASIAAEMLERRGGGRAARAEVAAAMGVSEGYVAGAARVRKVDPEADRKVRAGEKTLSATRSELGLDRPRGSRSSGILVDNRPATTLESVREEYEERAAIREQDSDEAWVESLELFRKLEGSCREAFARDAVAYRRLTPARKAWAAALAGEIKSNRRETPWLHRMRWPLECGDPGDWEFCSAEEGGCDGTGSQEELMGKSRPCPDCKGHGYKIH